MTRIVGIDPGTLSIDVCGIVNGQLYLDRSWPTAEAVSEAAVLVELLTTAGPPDLIAGPSGYGLPLRRAAELSETDLRLAWPCRARTGGARHRARSSHPPVTHQSAATPRDPGQ